MFATVVGVDPKVPEALGFACAATLLFSAACTLSCICWVKASASSATILKSCSFQLEKGVGKGKTALGHFSHAPIK